MAQRGDETFVEVIAVREPAPLVSECGRRRKV